MQTDLTFLRPEMSGQEARTVLDFKGISGAPVVSEDGTLIGVLSQTDLIAAMRGACLDEVDFNSPYLGAAATSSNSSEGEMSRLLSTKVEDLMSQRLFCVSPEDFVSSAAQTMRKYKVHRVIVTEQKRVVGIVTAFDLLQLLEK